ncbi:MAG: hypothetical protein WCE50_12285 [Candidatus Acidiferrum sp.]
MTKAPIRNYGKSQRELFAVFEEFFERATGKRRPREFATFESFDKTIRDNAHNLTNRHLDAHRFAWD